MSKKIVWHLKFPIKIYGQNSKKMFENAQTNCPFQTLSKFCPLLLIEESKSQTDFWFFGDES